MALTLGLVRGPRHLHDGPVSGDGVLDAAMREAGHVVSHAMASCAVEAASAARTAILDADSRSSSGRVMRVHDPAPSSLHHGPGTSYVENGRYVAT